MYKYTNIKAVLNYVPDGLIEEESEATLLKNALHGYTSNVDNYHIANDIKFAICKITNNKANMPVGVKKVLQVGYSNNLPSDINVGGTIFIQENFDGNHVTIFQSLVYQQFRPYFTSMNYVGQNSDLVDNNCVKLNCQDCINFSVDKQASFITTDIKDGYASMLYTSSVQDADGEFLVPDDVVLLQGLAYYVEARHWQSRAFRKEEGVEERFQTRMNMANHSFQEFNAKHLLDNWNYDDYVFKTQTVNRLPQLLFQAGRNR